MKHKYIEERHPPLYVRESLIQDSQVCCLFSEQDEFEVSKKDVRRLSDLHNRCVEELCNMANAFEKSDPEAFEKYWYGV